MDYSRIMSFRGKWRNYQARVLKNADFAHMSRKRVK